MTILHAALCYPLAPRPTSAAVERPCAGEASQHPSMLGGVNDGEELWQGLVRRHDSVLTLNGHVLGDGTGYLLSETDTGARCHQLLANYQMRDMGGEGYLRLPEFRTDGTVTVRAHSPLYDRVINARDHTFGFIL